jgi:hypothetical protein
MSNVKDIANLLASEHRKDDATIEAIYWLPHENEVRLIEVTKSVPADGSIMPFRFAPDKEILAPSLIVLIHPDDWARRADLKWPSELDPEKNDTTKIEVDNGESH